MLQVLLAACVMGVAVCQVPTRPDMFGLINILYYKADTNMDGIITEEELFSVYEGFDTNGDKQVTHAEFVPWFADLTGHDTEMASAYFFLADLNDNGVITDADVRPTFIRFDLNGDGQVTAQEFNLKWQEIYRESPLAVLYLRADVNHDDDLQPAEYSNLFASLDNSSASTSGSVRSSAFTATWVAQDWGRKVDAQALFTAIDGDGDGRASQAEVGAYMKGRDANGNGNIEILEVVQLVKLMPPLNN